MELLSITSILYLQDFFRHFSHFNYFLIVEIILNFSNELTAPGRVLEVLLICCLFNDGHVLQLWSETVAVRTQIIYGLDDIWWPYDNRGDNGLSFPEICVIVEEKPRKKTSTRKTDPAGDRTRTR